MDLLSTDLTGWIQLLKNKDFTEKTAKKFDSEYNNFVFSENNKIGLLCDVYKKQSHVYRDGISHSEKNLSGLLIKELNSFAGTILKKLHVKITANKVATNGKSQSLIDVGDMDFLAFNLDFKKKNNLVNSEQVSSQNLSFAQEEVFGMNILANSEENRVTTGRFEDSGENIGFSSLKKIQLNEENLEEAQMFEQKQVKNIENEVVVKKEDIGPKNVGLLKSTIFIKYDLMFRKLQRKAFLRWWVRTHKDFSKQCLKDFCMKSRLQRQVALWRFDKLRNSGKNLIFYMQSLYKSTWIGMTETFMRREKIKQQREAFNHIKTQYQVKKLQDKTLKEKFKYQFKSIIIKVMNKKHDLLNPAFYHLRSYREYCLSKEFDLFLQTQKKVVNKLTNQSFNWQRQAFNVLKSWCSLQKKICADNRSDQQRIRGAKQRFINRMRDSSLRIMGMAFRQAYVFMKKQSDLELEKGIKSSHDDKLKTEAIKRILTHTNKLQLITVRALNEFLGQDRMLEHKLKMQVDMQIKLNVTYIHRFFESSQKIMGECFNKAFNWTKFDKTNERMNHLNKLYVFNRIVNKDLVLMKAALEVLTNYSNQKINTFKEKCKFIIDCMGNKEKQFILSAYNGLKQSALAINRLKTGHEKAKRSVLYKRLINKGYDLQCMTIYALRWFLANEREKDNFKLVALKRMIDSNVRVMGSVFRQTKAYMKYDRDSERALCLKKRGICKRICDSSVRLMSAGYNKLILQYKNRIAQQKEKLKFVIASLTDMDKKFILCAYNGLRERVSMLNGVKMGNAHMKRVNLIKMLTNKAFNFQVMAINSQKEYLDYDRIVEERQRLEQEELLKIKQKTCKKIIDVNFRFLDQAFVQLKRFIEYTINKERQATLKKRNICKRQVDSDIRLILAGFNTLKQQWRKQQALLKEKCKFVISTLLNQDHSDIFKGYNSFKQRALAIEGIKIGKARNNKQQLIKRLINKGYDLQIMAIRSLKDYLKECKDQDLANQYANNLRKKTLVDMIKYRVHYEIKLKRRFWDFLSGWNQTFYLKMEITKSQVRRTYTRNEAQLQIALRKLKECRKEYIIYKRSRYLYNTLFLSDIQIKKAYKYYYRKLKQTTHKNIWYNILLNKMTKNTAVNEQIAWWRLHENRINLVKYPVTTIRSLEKGFDVIKVKYTKQIARAFWKFDKGNKTTIISGNSSETSFRIRYEKAHIKKDFYSDMYSNSRSPDKNYKMNESKKRSQDVNRNNISKNIRLNNKPISPKHVRKVVEFTKSEPRVRYYSKEK